MSLAPIRHRFLEVVGLRGYLALEDPTLEQIRQLQLQIDPARNLGTSVSDYRAILVRRTETLERLLNMPDTSVTILWCSYDIAVVNGERQIQTSVEGMMTYQLLVGAASANAMVWDLIVDKPLRGAGISRRIVEECHARFRKVGITRVHPLPSDKYDSILRRLFKSFGYTESRQYWLEYRL